MPLSVDVVVVGAGILGLATAYELVTRHPDQRIAVVDKESGPGRHQSGHNSGVLHTGIYYPPGSLKASLCVRGKTAMERFADEQGIPYQRCGKVIVALDKSELGRLEDLAARGRANGVRGVRQIDAAELREIEPYAVGIRALHIPETGIIDFGQVVAALVRLLQENGVEIWWNAEVLGIQTRGSTTVVRTGRGEVQTARVITCAGLHADRVARLAGATADVQIVPFRGDYYTLTPPARHLCRGLIYPVPDPTLPFLGVHLTKRVDGQVWAGPNAVLAMAREGYRRRDLNRRDLLETLRFPGFARLAQTYWRTGLAEVWRDLAKPAFVRDLQRYVPALRSDQLTFGPAGVRAQAVGLEGSLVDDFRLITAGTSLHLLNAPSPAATASLAIASRLVDEAERLGPPG